MADDQTVIDFQSKLILELETLGVENAASAFNTILASQKAAGNSIEDLIKQYGSMEDAVKALADEHKAFGVEASKALSKVNKDINKWTKRIKKAAGPLKEVGSGLKKLVFPASFGASLNTIDKYNKTMLSLSASTRMWGTGLTSLESNLDRIGVQTSLTREETNRLFDEFQAGMRTVSVGDFESTMKRIRSIVGSNVDAISKMQSSLADLSQSFPSLSSALADISSKEEDMTASEKSLIQTRVRNLYMVGKISDAQYKQVSAYMKGNQQIGRVDSQRKKDMDAQVAAWNDFKRQMESVAMAVGKTLMPFMTKIADLMKTIVGWTEKWLGGLGGVGAALTAVMATKGLASMAGGAVSNMGKNALASFAQKAGKKGGALGTVARMAGAAAATPVRVVNFDEMGGGGGITDAITDGLLDKITGGKGGKGGIKSFFSKKNLKTTFSKKGLRTYGGKGLSMATGGAFGTGAKYTSKLGRAGKFMKSPGAIVASVVGGYGLGKAEDYLDKKGRKKNAAAAGLGKSALNIGGGVATGAMIGSILGPVGTVIGGAVGGLIAVVSDWKGITSNLYKLVGKESQATKDKGKFAKELKQEKSDAQKELEQQRKVEISVKASEGRASGGGNNLAKEYQKALVEQGEAQKKYDDAVKKGKYKEKREKLGVQGKEVEEAKAKYNREVGKMNEDEKAGADEHLAKLEEQYNTNKDNLELEEKKDKVLQSSLNTLDETSAIAANITAKAQKQKDIAASIGALYQAQAGYLDTIIDRMGLMGQINEGELNKQISEGLTLINAKKDAYQGVIDILGSETTASEKVKALQEDQSKEGKIIYAGLADLVAKGDDELVVNEARKQAMKEIEGQQREQNDLLTKRLSLYDKELSQTGLIATQAGLMVQLADNYATGVGASADMRKQAIAAEEESVKVLQKQRQLAVENLAMQPDSMEHKNAILDIDNQILQKEMAISQQARTLRDGWVSAISAMNTGAGGFTDIVMTQSKGLALAQKQAGAVKAQTLGRVGSGEGYDASAGFRADITGNTGQTKRMSYRGADITGGQDPYKNPFKSGTDAPDDYSFIQEGNRNRMVDDLRKGREGSGFEAFSGHQYAREAEIARRSNSQEGKRRGIVSGKTYSSSPSREKMISGGSSATSTSKSSGGGSTQIVINIKADTKAKILEATKKQLDLALDDITGK